MRIFRKLSKDKLTVGEEVRLDVGKMVAIGGRKSSRHPTAWMVAHNYVIYVRPSVDVFYEKGKELPITLDGELKPVSYTNNIVPKPAATQRAYVRGQIEKYASRNIAKNNSAGAKMSAKDAFNDIVVDKYKNLITSLSITPDKDLETFDFVSMWDDISDFENPGVIAAVWARLMAWLGL